MVDLSTVGYKVDASGLVEGERALNSFSKAHRKLVSSVTPAAKTATERFVRAYAKAQRKAKKRRKD